MWLLHWTKKTLLPDVNLLLALVFERHFHHTQAKAWFDSLQDAQCHICRMTQQGLLLLATNPRVMQEDAVTLSDAWALLGRAFVGSTYLLRRRTHRS